MGTNYYFFSRDKKTAQHMGPKAVVVDEPEFGYELHIAKTSFGWQPLFEAHRDIRSVRDLRRFYANATRHDNTMTILDEYGRTYSWEEFEQLVIRHGTPKRWNPDEKYYEGNWRCESDNDCVKPWNHWEGEWADADGYRFQESEFC